MRPVAVTHAPEALERVVDLHLGQAATVHGQVLPIPAETSELRVVAIPRGSPLAWLGLMSSWGVVSADGRYLLART